MSRRCIQKRKQQPARRRLRNVSHGNFAFSSKGEKPSGRGMGDGLPSVPLRTLLDRERRVLPNPAQLPKGVGVIDWPDRNREASWICTAGRKLGMQIDGVSLAVSLFDKVAMTIKVPVKYVNVVSAACVHIARKLCEDDEDEAWTFCEKLSLPYSPNELKRMEMSVLQAAQWDAHLPSVERFVALLLQQFGGQHIHNSIHLHMESVLQDHTIVCEFPPSTVALSIISHVLEATGKQWMTNSQKMVRMCMTDMASFMRCREKVAACWRASFVPSLSSFCLLAAFEDAEMPSYSRTTSPQTTADSPAQQLTSPRLQATPC